MPIDLAFMVNHLPPQAYSKETLIQAYNWLRNQPPQVQEMAKSPDVLVSLFSKAQMHGDAYMNRTHMQNFKTELKSLANMMGDFDSTALQNEQLSEIESLKQQVQQQQQAQVQQQSQQQQMQMQMQQQQRQQEQIRQQEQSRQLEPQQVQAQQQTQVQQALQQMQQQAQMQQQLAQQHQQGQQQLMPQVQQVQVSQQQQQQQMSPAVIPPPQQILTQTQSLPVQPALDMRSVSMIQEVKNQFNLSSESEALRLLISIGYQKIRTDL